MKKLYLGNLPFQATEDDLSQWFSQAGVHAATITIVRDRFTGQARGFGFAEIADDGEADRAIQSLNGTELGGRRVVVNEARPQREGGGGGRGRGGYGGGGGGGRGRGGGRDRDSWGNRD